MAPPPAARPAGEAGRERLDQRYVVARAADIPEGERIIVDVAGRSVGVFNVDGKFYAMLNRCPHRGAELCKGDVIGAVESEGPGDVTLDASRTYLACPWHGWEFDLETGRSWYAPGRTRARPFAVSVAAGAELEPQLADGAAEPLGAAAASFVDVAGHRIKGPYEASVVPVAVEDEYVVLSLRRILPKNEA